MNRFDHCTPPPLYKLRPCPSYSRRRDRNNFVRNLITYEMQCGHIRHGFAVTFTNVTAAHVAPCWSTGNFFLLV